MNSPVTSLLADLRALGVSVGVEGDRLWYAPRSAVTSELLDRLRRHREDLLLLLGRTAVRCDRCRSTEYRDVSIHGGRSVRRDCAKCGRFLDFPVWYGVNRES
ncbi:MAG: hypothetical protein A2W31_03425 [Planctomycetes bacterium RBG_16_64_10]|nr:MAG: hypothetical protein A2W31_03425 [Planctomycetes bacterium RBG_16_64_10]